MRQKTAELATSIKVITILFLSVTLFFAVATYFYNDLLIPALIMAMISSLCFLYSPRYYDLSGRSLRIICRVGEKEFQPVKHCTLLTEESMFGVRLWGNGGLFSATGIFWSKSHGVFRAYVTRSGAGNLVMISTPSHKIVISPEKPAAFVKGWQNSQQRGEGETEVE